MALFSKETPPPGPQPRVDTHAPATGAAATHIGPNIAIEGSITGSEPIVIEGVIKGNINVTNDLRIGTKARVEANVHGRNVAIEGKLTGDISADERVELVASAAVDGNVKAPKIIVAEGAKFRGSVDMGSPRPKEAAEVAPARAKS